MSEEEKPKKGGFLKWSGIGCGGLLLLIIIMGGCIALVSQGGDDDSGDTAEDSTESSEEEQNGEGSNEETATEETDSGEQEESTSEDEEVVEEEEADETVGIGETLTVDDIDFTVNDWYQQDTVGNDVVTETANDTYLILDVSVTNNQNEAATIMSDYFKIVDGETVYEPDTAASSTANMANSPDDIGLLAEEINPGSSRDALVVFDVAPGVIESDSKEVQVQSGMFGTQTGIITLQ